MTDEAAVWRDAAFRKSSFSGSTAECLEIARVDTRFGVRDSKDPFGPLLAVPVDRGDAFLGAIKSEQIAAP
jgi:Domain of unknown function (DUF397)